MLTYMKVQVVHLRRQWWRLADSGSERRGLHCPGRQGMVDFDYDGKNCGCFLVKPRSAGSSRGLPKAVSFRIRSFPGRGDPPDRLWLLSDRVCPDGGWQNPD